MAAKDLDSDNIKHQELNVMITCCICTEVYTDPKALPCIHTFCMKCIQETGLKNNKGPGDEMPCPICRRMFKLPPEGFRGLPKNFFIEKLIQSAIASVKSATSRVVCDACLDDKKDEADKEIPVADTYCVECNHKLCEKCSVEHRKFKFTRNHKLIIMTEYEECQKGKTIPAPSVCELHEQKALDIYCAYCKTVVCAICFIDDHKNHEGSHVSKFVDGFQKQIEINAKAINECRSKAENKKAEFLKVKENMLKRVENLECDIEKRKDELKQLTDKHAVALLQRINATKQCKLKEIEMATAGIDAYMLSLETCNSHSLKIISRGSPADIFREFSYLSVRAMELQEQCQPMIEREIQSFNFRFQKSDLEEFMQESCGSMIGEIEEESDSKPKKAKSPLLNEQLRITINKETKTNKALKEELDERKAKYDSGLEKLKQELDKYKATVCRLQVDNDTLKQELHARNMTNTSLQISIDELIDKLVDAVTANTSAQTERDKLKQDLDKEKLTNKNLVENVNTYKTSIKTLEDNVEKLKQKLEMTKRDFLRHNTVPLLVQIIKTKATEDTKKGIFGLTILDKELFVLSRRSLSFNASLPLGEPSSEVEVYDSTKLSFSRRWNLKELFYPCDIGSCSRNKCVYIFNRKVKGQLSEILRVDPNGTLIKKWPAEDDHGRLSITGESNIILTGSETHTLKEYSPDGQLLRELKLSSDAGILVPYRAIKLANGQFVVSHGIDAAELHRVCVVDAAGKLVKSFGGKRGSAITQLNSPLHLVVVESGFVMVADRENSRVLLLDSDLKFKREILSKKKHGLRDPNRILLDETNARIFISDNKWDSTKKLFRDGRILVFSF